MKIILCALLLLYPFIRVADAAPVAANPDGIAPCLRESGLLSYEADTTTRISTSALESAYQCAVRYRASQIELFNVMTVLLTKQQMRVRVAGDAIRAASARYTIGGGREHALFPMADIIALELGAPLLGQPQITVHLRNMPPLYTEQVNIIGAVTIRIATYYGFRMVRARHFAGAFGLAAEALGKERPVDNIHIYEHNKIAIYAQGFIRPKRWELHTITEL